MTTDDTSEVERQPWDKVHAAIEFIRGCWDDDGAEGESIHLICDDLERAEATIATLRAEVEVLRKAESEKHEAIKRMLAELAERDRTIAKAQALLDKWDREAMSPTGVEQAGWSEIFARELRSALGLPALSEPGEGGGK